MTCIVRPTVDVSRAARINSLSMFCNRPTALLSRCSRAVVSKKSKIRRNILSLIWIMRVVTKLTPTTPRMNRFSQNMAVFLIVLVKRLNPKLVNTIVKNVRLQIV
uniref:Uncharacterized protein n=1 Tax=Cacopsylla melanoneura TaxID=428564 RepID=A0A8D9BMU9_9HEMI